MGDTGTAQVWHGLYAHCDAVPGRTRDQIRNKFKKEEKENGESIDLALKSRLPIGTDLEILFLCFLLPRNTSGAPAFLFESLLTG